jgi:hypothetical protein
MTASSLTALRFLQLGQIIFVLIDFQYSIRYVIDIASGSKKQILSEPYCFFTKLVVIGIVKLLTVSGQPLFGKTSFEILGIQSSFNQAISVLGTVSAGAGNAFRFKGGEKSASRQVVELLLFIPERV